MLFMPQLMTVLAPGFERYPEKYALTVALTRITMPYILFISLVSLQGGILNSLDKFAAVAATPAIMNATLIITQLALVGHTQTPAHALAYGVLVAGVTQYLWMVYYCRRANFLPKLVWPRFTPNVKKLFTLIGPAALGAGVAQINLLIDTIIASKLDDAVSFLYYADRIAEFPLGVIGIAVATALLPMMSRQIREGKRDAAIHSQNRALELSYLFGLPAAFACCAIAMPIIVVVFEHGAFSRADTGFTYPTLIAYSLGLPAFLAVKIFASGFYASRDTKTPVKIAVLCVGINLALNLLSLFTLRSTGYAHVGLAMSTTVAGWVNAICLCVGLRRRGLFAPDAMLRFRLPRMLLASALMAALVYAAFAWMGQGVLAPGLMRYLAVGGLIALGMLSYGALILLLKVLDVRQLQGYFRRGTMRNAAQAVKAEQE
jgi:putative peptidoglycan lipid II flippase